MADNKIRMPSSGAGITTFYEESKSKIAISPYTVIGLALIITLIVIIANNVA